MRQYERRLNLEEIIWCIKLDCLYLSLSFLAWLLAAGENSLIPTIYSGCFLIIFVGSLFKDSADYYLLRENRK